MIRFSHFYVLAIGSFIIAGAHYVRNGEDGWYAGWVGLAALLTMFGSFLGNSSTRPELED